MKAGSTVTIQRQSSSLHSGRALILKTQKARQVKSATKSMLIVFFDICWIMQCEFVPSSKIVNAAFYCVVLRYVREDIWCRRPELRVEKNWMLYIDSVSPHRVFKKCQYCTCTKMVITLHLPHPPTHQIWSPVISFCFPRWCGGDSTKIADTAWQTSRKWLPEIVPKLAEALESVYNCRRDLFQKKWQQNLKHIYVLFTGLVSEFNDHIL